MISQSAVEQPGRALRLEISISSISAANAARSAVCRHSGRQPARVRGARRRVGRERAHQPSPGPRTRPKGPREPGPVDGVHDRHPAVRANGLGRVRTWSNIPDAGLDSTRPPRWGTPFSLSTTGCSLARNGPFPAVPVPVSASGWLAGTVSLGARRVAVRSRDSQTSNGFAMSR